jgi:hypothetical protein
MLTINLPSYAGQQIPILPIAGSSTAANASMTATLSGAVGQVTYIEGFDVTSGNATVASTQVVTVNGVTNGPLYFDLPIQGSNSINVSASVDGQLSIRFPEPLPASASNTAITVVVPALGSGNAVAAVTAYGVRAPLGVGQT